MYIHVYTVFVQSLFVAALSLNIIKIYNILIFDFYNQQLSNKSHDLAVNSEVDYDSSEQNVRQR